MKISIVMMIIGGIVTLIAVIWWSHFYGPSGNNSVVFSAMGISTAEGVSRTIKCLYSFDAPCNMTNSLAEMFGQQPYNPTIFWTGIIIFGIGIVVFMFSVLTHKKK